MATSDKDLTEYPERDLRVPHKIPQSAKRASDFAQVCAGFAESANSSVVPPVVSPNLAALFPEVS